MTCMKNRLARNKTIFRNEENLLSVNQKGSHCQDTQCNLKNVHLLINWGFTIKEDLFALLILQLHARDNYFIF